MKWSLIYLLALIVAWQQTDLIDGGVFSGVVAPLACFGFFVAFLFSLLAWFARCNKAEGGPGGDIAPGYWGSSDRTSSQSDGGSDGGGGDGGG